MRELNITKAILSAVVVWILGVTAFVISYFIPIMEDPDAQANWVLSMAIIPAVALGAYLYYRGGHKTNGIQLGCFMFLITMLLDALITVPVFIIPNGGNHLTFFGDPGFWIIGLEYVTVICAYWLINKSNGLQRDPETMW